MPSAVRVGMLLAVCGLLAVPSAGAFPPERRRSYEDRAPNEYLLIPAVASLPGIGVFVGVIASASNVGDTGINVGGGLAQSIDNTDIRLRALALQEVPIWRPALTFDYQIANIKVGNLQSYLPGRNSPNFTIPLTAEFDFQLIRPILTLFERRFTLSYTLGFFDGFVLDEQGNEQRFASHSASGSLQLDFTDDVVDPRRGLRLAYRRSLPAPKESILGRNSEREGIFGNGSDITSHNVAFTFYMPMSRRFVLVQDTEVFYATGGEDSGEVVSGGSLPLRGYPGGRWSDRYGVFLALEGRYTIPLNRKLDIVLASGILEGLQFSGFYEVGQVAPHNDRTLFEDMHQSYGGGVRVLLQAIVLRLDLATSDEGPQTTLTVGYSF